MKQDINPLLELIDSAGTSGIVSADITRLTGSNQYHTLQKAEKQGILVSIPTNRRHKGRRWFTTENWYKSEGY